LSVTGKATGTKVKVLPLPNGTQPPGTKPWLLTAIFYDKYGRTIHSWADNHFPENDTHDKVTNTYDFAGRLLSKLTQHKGKEAVNINEFFTYDHSGRPLMHYHQLNDGPKVVLSQSKYNELGQLVDKYVHNTNSAAQPGRVTRGIGYPGQYEYASGQGEVIKASEEITLVDGFWAKENSTVTAQLVPVSTDAGDYLQNVSYRYNIRGWLTKINEVDALDSKDLFGLRLQYNEGGQYNGNIAIQQWKTRTEATPVARQFTYGYDAASRLTSAAYSSPKEDDAFSVSGITYYSNGNLKTMNQRGLSSYGTVNSNQLQPQYGLVDQLSYQYEGNRLKKVEDAITNQRLASDFQNGVNKQKEYTYDDVGSSYGNGNLTSDENKGLSTIAYNHLNLPERINVGEESSEFFQYVYSGTGSKLYKEVTESGMSRLRTDYVNGVVYVGNRLQFIPTAEGRVVHPNFLQDGSTSYAYEYHYKDHLGNLRLAYREPKPAVTFTATMEVEQAYKEEAQFVNVGKTRDNGRGRTSSASARLNGDPNSSSYNVLGPWKTIQVKAFDTFKAQVRAYYESTATSTGTPLSVYVETRGNLKGGGESGNNASLLSLGLSINPAPNPSSGEPKAYLQVIYFDKDYKYITSRIRKVTTAAKGNTNWQPLVVDPATDADAFPINQDGYLQVLVANEGNIDVWFDELTITHKEALLVQENHYSPWGLNLAGIEKTGAPDHKFQYNNRERQTELGLNWTAMDFRQYDMQLGRFHAIDPLAGKFGNSSPYAFVLNNPLRYADPTGLDTLAVGKDGIPIAPTLPEVVVTAEATGDVTDVDQKIANSPNVRRAMRTLLPGQGYARASGATEQSNALFFVLAPASLPFKTSSKLANFALNALNPIGGMRGGRGGIGPGGLPVLPIRNLSFSQVRITAKGVGVVEQHLSRFSPDAANATMIQRLRDIESGLIQATEHDLKFYTHELREFVRFRQGGFRTGDAPYDFYRTEHSATLSDYGIPDDRLAPYQLYHPSAVQAAGDDF
jgi:RHS repeat-associated protein